MITYRGQIVPVFTVPPNWKKPFVLTELSDDLIAETLDTGEERLGTRTRPRFRVKYLTLTLTPQETGYIRKVLEQDDSIPIGVGLWQDAIKITAPSIAGNTFLNTDATANLLFDVAPYALVWKSFKDISTVRTLFVVPTGLQLADGLDIDFEAGDWVVPMVIGKISRENMTSLTDEHATFEVKFDEFTFVDAPILCAAITGTDLDVTLAMQTECEGGSLL